MPRDTVTDIDGNPLDYEDDEEGKETTPAEISITSTASVTRPAVAPAAKQPKAKRQRAGAATATATAAPPSATS